MKPLNTDMNAQRWAKEFVELHGLDEDLMRSWFANAIMCGWDNYYWSTDEYKQTRDSQISNSIPIKKNSSIDIITTDSTSVKVQDKQVKL